MALDTYNKYLNRAIEHELFYVSGNNGQLKKLKEIAEQLGLVDKAGRYSKYLRLKDLSKLNFCQITSWARESMVLQSLDQQKYQIKKALDEISFLDKFLNKRKGELLSYSRFKRIQKKAAQYGVSTEQYLHRVKKKQKKVVVTGCNHLSKKFGNCKATMNGAINKLKNDGFIERYICKREFKEYDISNESFDSIKATYGTNALFINYSKQSFIQTIGSEIKIVVDF